MVVLDGDQLTLEQVLAVACRDEPVSLHPRALERMRRSRAVVERLAAAGAPVYGVNTGVGRLAEVCVPAGQLEQLQRNIVRSHACGVGEPLRRPEVRAMMLIRANTLAKGFSGIRPLVAERLVEMLNGGVTPVVPSRGSVGASGDLAPLAHIALVLMGEGQAEVQGVVCAGPEALARAGLVPLTLAAKEGVSLINGTQGMLAIGCLELAAAETLVETADLACAMTLDALRGTPRAFDPRLHALRPFRGQARSAAHLRRLLQDSPIRESHLGCSRVQDAYSLRCAPQVHGAVRDALSQARSAFSLELNAATDNPLVLGEEIVSGGNFHGQPLALLLDYLAIALTTLAQISERRLDRLLNPVLNEGLPPFLAENPGLESGFMMLQATAAALVAENRVLAYPATAGSIPTSGDKEDFVSMGMTAALKLRTVTANTRAVLALELLAAARALDLLAPLASSPAIERVRAEIRRLAPPAPGDRSLSAEIARLAEGIAEGVLLRAAAGETP